VLPIFKDMESYQGDGDDEYRGRDGPLKVSESNESGPLYDALIKAAGQVGIAYTKDYNGARQDGIGVTQTTIRRGRRMSTAVCYLNPARRRPNLKMQANALTECLLFDGKGASGSSTASAVSDTKPAPTGKSLSAPDRSIRRSCWNCPVSAGRRCCRRPASRCATSSAGSAKTCVTIIRRA
jgi:choline dehydrogenase-like flavoprotein